MIPKGLEIKKIPLVSGELVPREPSDEMEQYIKKTSQLLLKHLKSYHKTILIRLKNEVRKVQAILNNSRKYKESASPFITMRT